MNDSDDDIPFGTGDLYEHEEGWFCLWAGDLSKDDLERYLEERSADEGWTSDFREDLGRFYDHDWLTIGASEEPLSIPDLLAKLGYRDADFPALMKAVRANAPPEHFRSVVLLLKARATPFMSEAEFCNGRLRFIGSWPES